MNGQTGKLIADIPVSKVKVFWWMLSGLLLLSGSASCLAVPFYPLLAKIAGKSVLYVIFWGAIIMIFPMMIYAEIAPVRRLFSGRLSSRLTGSLMACAGIAFMAAAGFSAPGDYGKNFLFLLAVPAGGSLAVFSLRGGIRKRLAAKLSRSPCKDGSMYAAKSYLRYRNIRKKGEKTWLGREKSR